MPEQPAKHYISDTDSTQQVINRRATQLQWAILALTLVGGALLLGQRDAEAMRAPSMLPSNSNLIELKLPIPGYSFDESTFEQQASMQWKTITVENGDNLYWMFKKNNLDSSVIHKILSLGKPTKQLKELKPGQALRLKLDNNNTPHEVIYDISPLISLHIQSKDGEWKASTIEKEYEKRFKNASGVIKSSLFEAAQESGMSTGLIMQLATIFGWDIDFALDIREGDSFTISYEELYLNGEKIKDGNILAAEFSSQSKVYRAVRYTDETGRAEYYTPDGHNMRKTFLRTPVDFTRISSRYGKRHHPVHKRVKTHKGVDYAAPAGTPIRAAGDGKVIFKGRKGGYGKTIVVKHGQKYSTLYAHMRSYAKGVRSGKQVKQGQIIGYVGKTGTATGPHLHYEFRVYGQHKNPLTVRPPKAAPIKTAYKEDFLAKTKGLIAQLDFYKRYVVARSDNENTLL